MNGRPWSATDSQTLRRLLQAGLTNQEIGQRMERHKDMIRHKVRELGLTPGQSPAMSAMMMRLRYRRRIASKETATCRS